MKRDNPKQVNGLDGFGAGSPITTGICAPELLCGRAGAQALERAGVNAAPTVVTSNVDELTDGVKTGRIDAVLALRTDLRRVIDQYQDACDPRTERYRVDYQMPQFRRPAVRAISSSSGCRDRRALVRSCDSRECFRIYDS